MGKIPVSKIADLRRAVGMTQRQLADAVGVTESTVSNWEQGRNALKQLEQFAKLCKVLKCSPDDLVGYVDLEED
jgi:transcriptional regulator with XRE-family HTH domain